MNLKIAFVTETFPPEINGVAMTVGRLVEGMRALGHQVSVIRPRQHGGAAGAAADDHAGGRNDLLLAGLPLPGYPGLRFGLPAGRQLARAWRQSPPDLVHVVTEGPLGWSAVNVARRLGIPVTSGFHTNFDRYSVHYGIGWLRPAVAAYLRALHRRTRATMVPTEALAADLAGEGIAGVRVVGRGVDTALFDPARRSDVLRAAWGAGAGNVHAAPVCLYVGRLAPEKNLALVRRAFAAIRAQQPQARMIWVGDGPSRRTLEAEHAGDTAHRFTGNQVGEALASHYASADLFLFPSLSETYGNVVAEAMASGLPVLAYRAAAAAELIASGRNGITVPPGDEANFLRAAQAMVEHPATLRVMSREARASMLPRNWASVVERFESVAREALAG